MVLTSEQQLRLEVIRVIHGKYGPLMVDLLMDHADRITRWILPQGCHKQPEGTDGKD
jgi:hypothetical protein